MYSLQVYVTYPIFVQFEVNQKGGGEDKCIILGLEVFSGLLYKKKEVKNRDIYNEICPTDHFTN